MRGCEEQKITGHDNAIGIPAAQEPIRLAKSNTQTDDCFPFLGAPVNVISLLLSMTV
jgi:hypothetical protein